MMCEDEKSYAAYLAYLDAIQRLPQISVIFYNDPVTRSRLRLGDSSRDEDHAEQAVYVPVEPADPFVEAIRTAQEIGAQVVFADPDTNERPHLPDSYPDSWALQLVKADAEYWRVAGIEVVQADLRGFLSRLESALTTAIPPAH